MTLAPCPFCGSEASVTEGSRRFSVVCRGVDCFCSLGEGYDTCAMPDFAYYTEEQAVYAWNLRDHRNLQGAAKLPDWAGSALTSSTAKITIVGNTPTAGGKLSEQNWRDWLKSIPDPVEPVV